jgi:hypothetical protein
MAWHKADGNMMALPWVHMSKIRALLSVEETS